MPAPAPDQDEVPRSSRLHSRLAGGRQRHHDHYQRPCGCVLAHPRGRPIPAHTETRVRQRRAFLVGFNSLEWGQGRGGREQCAGRCAVGGGLGDPGGLHRQDAVQHHVCGQERGAGTWRPEGSFKALSTFLL